MPSPNMEVIEQRGLLTEWLPPDKKYQENQVETSRPFMTYFKIYFVWFLAIRGDAQGSLLAVLGRPFVAPQIEMGLTIVLTINYRVLAGLYVSGCQ